MQNVETKYQTPLFPVTRPCTAKSKRSGTQCRNWSMANGKCRMHGGRSIGPQTESGRQRIAANRRVHGKYSAITIKKRWYERTVKLCESKYNYRQSERELQNFWQRIEKMSWREFTKFRKKVRVGLKEFSRMRENSQNSS